MKSLLKHPLRNVGKILYRLPNINQTDVLRQTLRAVVPTKDLKPNTVIQVGGLAIRLDAQRIPVDLTLQARNRRDQISVRMQGFARR
jgi:hypothetical protein